METLVECAVETTVSVARISDQDPGFLNYIAESGLNPGVVLKVLVRNMSSESVCVQLVSSGESMTLGLGAAAKVLVRSM